MEDAVPTVTLDADEALILFEMLSRWNEDPTFAPADQAEQRVLWNLCCALEEQLAEPFQPDYPAILAAARDRVRDPQD
jgi:hypothetical protein